MDVPSIPLPLSAYIMAALSAVFVFFGATFAGGGGVLLLHDRLHWPVWTLVVAVPLVVISSVILGCLSAWESLQQARKKALLAANDADMLVKCDGCGENFSQAPRCPLCGRPAAAESPTTPVP